MIEPGEGLGFAPDPLTGAGHVAGAAVQDQVLEGDGLAVGVDGQVDHAHGAASEALLQLITHRAEQLTAARCPKERASRCAGGASRTTVSANGFTDREPMGRPTGLGRGETRGDRMALRCVSNVSIA